MENVVPRIGASKRSSDAPKMKKYGSHSPKPWDVGTAAMRRF
jgi:hypothetical protein